MGLGSDTAVQYLLMDTKHKAHRQWQHPGLGGGGEWCAFFFSFLVTSFCVPRDHKFD